MSEPVLLVEKKDRIATVTLNRPKAMNALSTELRVAITETFEHLKDDSEVDVVILTGAGRAFCAGLDLKELSDGMGMLGGGTDGKSLGTNMATPLKHLGKPIIGAINGVAITGGFELAVACDILIASTRAKFADTHARVGILPGWELSQKLSRLVGISRAKEISLTGNFIDAGTAEAWGLVNRVVKPELLLPVCHTLAKDILSCPQDMIRTYKKLIDDGFHLAYGDSLELEQKTGLQHLMSVTPDAIAGRREGIMERGRTQKD